MDTKITSEIMAWIDERSLETTCRFGIDRTDAKSTVGFNLIKKCMVEAYERGVEDGRND